VKKSEVSLRLEDLEGVGKATCEKLNMAGVFNIKQLMLLSPAELQEVLNTSYERASEMLGKAESRLKKLGVLGVDFVTADKIMEERRALERISTGSTALDGLLGGGVETGALTEFYGEYGSGKTQVCHTLSIMAQLPRDRGGLEAGIVYIDSENTFRPERARMIAVAKGLDPDVALSNIFVGKTYNATHQEILTRGTPKLIEEKNVKLLIVDSVMTHYRSEFFGRGQLADRQQRLNRYIHLLLKIAEIYKVAVVVTNQVQAAPDVIFGDPTRPTGGHIFGHASTYRIYLRKAGKNRIARMVDSPQFAESEVVFHISENGIEDAKNIV